MQPHAPIRMTVHWLWKAVYILGLVLFLALALLSVSQSQVGPALLFLGFGVLTAFALILARSYVEVDGDKILLYSSPFDKYLIRWDEISTVETNGIGYVFRGNDKALGFNAMMGRKTGNIRVVINEQITRWNIAVTRVRQTPSVMPKNTRVV